MNELELIPGIILGVGGAIILAAAYLNPESIRRENRRVRDLAHRARKEGLRGRYKFASDRSKWDSAGGFGTYEPIDSEDREVYYSVGSRIEGESLFFAEEMFWTGARPAWVGVPALLIGAAICLISIIG
ncbi:MAG: hypothetical protein ACLQD8_04695 [Thermoplasmata archaeon]